MRSARRALVLLVAPTVVAGCGGATRAARSTTTTTTTTAPILAPAATADASTGPVGPLAAPGGRFLVDRYGRDVLLHGADLVYKVPPYEVEVGGTGVNTLTPAEAQSMAALGFDVVRLGIIWKGLEPGHDPIDDASVCKPGAPRASGPGQFDAAMFATYMSRLDATIALLGRYGISSVVDMHQDVYSDAFGGEGAPDWAVCTGGATPRPQLGVPNWSVNLTGPGVVTAYEHFWRNDVVGNLQGEFDSVWAKVATHLRDNPWVVGYDPYNEPYGQAVPPYTNGAPFDAELQCFYAGRQDPGTDQSGHRIACPPDDPATGLIARLEQADPNHLVFYEGNYATDSGPVNHIGPMPFPRLVLNFHDYCFLHIPNGPEAANFATVCGPLENQVFLQHAAQAKNDASASQPGGIPDFLTEFGATTDAADLGRIVADADAHLVGWMYWQWLLYDDPTGSHTSGLWPPSAPTPAMEQVLARAYPMAVAGTPLATSFDPSSASFSLRYTTDPRITEPTVVFIPLATHYAGGYCATATGARITSAPGSGYLDLANPATAGTATVTVVPGACAASTSG